MISNGLMVRLSECAVEQVYELRSKFNIIFFFFMQAGQGKCKSENKEKQAIVS